MLLYWTSGPYFSNKVTINLHYFQENKVDKPKLLIIYVMPFLVLWSEYIPNKARE